MIGKVNATCKSLSVKNRKDSLTVPVKQQVQKQINKKSKPSSPNDVLVIDNRGTTIEVTVKTKGRKSTSAMVSNSLNSSKMIDEKPVSTNVMETHATNWSRTLREQNRPALKQGLQQLAGQMQPSKQARHENSERKEIRTIMETHQSKYIRQDSRIFNEVPVKQAAKKSEQAKTVPNSAVPSTTTIASSLESIEVTDRGVQCGGIFDSSSDKFGIYNPVRMLGILMQEMEGLVKDERSSKILIEMEQALLRIPREPGKLPPDVLEKIALCAKLESGMMQLENTSRELEAASVKLRKDKESLQQQVTKQAKLLEESQQREQKAEITIKKLKMDLNESLKSIAENKKIIAALREENKGIEVSQKLARDLRKELNEQIELAEQRYMEIQYLKLEKDKLTALSAYKDAIQMELRKKLKELQNQWSEQLVNVREAYDHQISIIQGGVAFSSPTSSSSKNSLCPRSCPELSEISLSTVDCFFPNSAAQMNAGLNVSFENYQTKKVTDKTNSEFVSLPGEETWQTASWTHKKEREQESSAAKGDKKTETTGNGEWKLGEFFSAPNLGTKDTGVSQHEKDDKDHRSKTKTRKVSSDGKQFSEDSKRFAINEESGKPDVQRSSGDPVSIKEQFEIMFQDIRRQSKLIVPVPSSPPPNCPYSDWTDTSVPTISAMSESNVP